MEFRILGPLEVVDRGRLVELGSPGQRALLALLLINANRVLSTDRLLEELWGDDAVGKENALWVYVSRLRSALEPERTDRGQSSVLITRDHGYLLSIEPGSIDAYQFELAAAEGKEMIKDDPDAASKILTDALRLWRGSPLEDFTYREFAQLEIARLESLHLTATQDRIEADLRRGLSGELVAELEALRSLHPTEEKIVEQQMLALYQAGRQADALRAFEGYRRHLAHELGLVPSPELRRLEEQVLLHDPGLRLRLPAVGRAGIGSGARHNPFKGLRPFGEDDSSEFFGRDRLVADLAKRIMSGSRLLALIGPSGSGKSSVLHAGLIPTLRKGDLGGTASWQVASMVPGAHPFAELEAALLRSSLDVPNSLGQLMDDPEVGALTAALRVLPDDGARLLLAIDQFEELFTLTDPGERDRFIANLLPMIDDPHGRIAVVLTLRAGFYDRPLAYPEFGKRLGEGIMNVVPPTPDELEEAAQKPAEAVGVFLTPSLLTSLLTDVIGRPGSLPLFQYALTELFDRRTGDVLTLDDYQEIHGLNGVLTRKADDLFTTLTPEEQAAARQLFLRLVTIADAREWGRRRVLASELVDLRVDLVALQAVIELYAQHHLLTLDRDSTTGSPTVEVAHEALLTEWELLRGWIEDGLEDVRRYAALTSAMNEWNESGRNADFLLTGTRLKGYERWASSSALALTSNQLEYLEAAIEARNQAAQLEEEQRSLVERTRRAARRRLWAFVATFLLLVGVGTALILIANQPSPFSVAVIAPSVAPYQNSLVATGVARAERELPVEIDFRRRVASLEDEYRALAASGTDMIFIDPGNSGWEYVVDVIAEFPDTAFAVVDGVVPPAGALSTYVADEGGGYMAGLAAGFTTETGVVGFVGHRQSQTAEYWRAGFEAGVMAVDPSIEVVSTYISDDSNAYQDVDGGVRAALRLFGLGADVVLAFAEEANLGVIEAAWQSSRDGGVHRWAIASGSDWSLEVAEHLKPHVLTSAFKRWDVAMFETIRTFTEGRFEPGIKVLSLADDGIGLAESAYLDDDLMNRIDELAAPMAATTDTIPRVPSLEVLPPAGMVDAHEVTVIWNGQDCAYTGDSTFFTAGTAFRVRFVNMASANREFWTLHSDGASFDVPLSVLVGPDSSHIGYMAPRVGTVELRCGPDLRSGEAVKQAVAATLTID